MIASPQFNYLSPTEYLHLEEQSDLKHEYIDGEVYAMAGASDRHVTVSLNPDGIQNPLVQIQSVNLDINFASIYEDVEF